MKSDEAIKTSGKAHTFEELKESLIKHTEWKSEYVQAAIIMLREIFEALAALDSLAVEPSDDLAQYVNELLDFGIEFAGKRCDDDAMRIWNLVNDYVTARDERIRRECVTWMIKNRNTERMDESDIGATLTAITGEAKK